MKPILWSFRRCPYAMRARLALASAQIEVEHREILLRDKPQDFLNANAAGTVPVLVEQNETFVHSLDIMKWALAECDPELLLDMPSEGHDLIAQADTSFKTALDRYKYHVRFDDADRVEERSKASLYLNKLDHQLGANLWLFGDQPRLADLAILPFVRQFAHVDLDWFSAQPWHNLIGWLERFKASERFNSIMTKHPLWRSET